MIDDLDRTLEKLLRDKVPLPVNQCEISFDLPSEAWANTQRSRERPTVNVYLYDVRENHELRARQWQDERQPDGTLLKRRPRVRVDLSYFVTAWSPVQPPDVLDEHRLMTDMLRTLLRYATLPSEVLQGSLIEQEPPLPTLVAQPDGPRNPAEFWNALRNLMRPGILLTVTIGIDPSAHLDIIPRLQPVASRTLEIGRGSGWTYHLRIRPPLPAVVPRGAGVSRMDVGNAVLASLTSAVYASRDVIRVRDGATLRSHALVMIDDGAATEFVRLGIVSGEGEVDIPVTPVLRFPHGQDRGIHNVTVPLATLTTLEIDAAVGIDRIRVRGTNNISVGDWLMLDDERQTEGVRVQSIDRTVREVQVAPSLQFSHRAGLFVRKLSPDPTAATASAQPAAQSTPEISLDRVDRIVPGTFVMLDSGPRVEFMRVGTPSGGAVPVDPSLQHNHVVGAALRSVTEAERFGRLAVGTSLGQSEVVMFADHDAARAIGQDRLVHPGDVIKLEGSVAIVQVTELSVQSGVPSSAPQVFAQIGGEVTDDAAPPHPVAGARVLLVELSLAAMTSGEGRFTFSNLSPGEYTLRVTAAGYDSQDKTVRVPALTADEYRVRLSP